MKVMMQSRLTGSFSEMEIDISIEDYINWQNASADDPKRFVHTAFPHLSADEREFLISGITPDEWANAFGTDDEDI